ncbi:hypothetical protein E1281_38015 [Actinomadura sp. KC345]|nr:hypothetical protein E1281_38015 [Actinomadura sp. KC345]
MADLCGGPFIAIPDSVRDQWHGADPDSDFEGPYDTRGDYGRACQATDADYHVAVIDVGGAQALVLGEGKGAATFLHDRLLFVQYAPDGPESEFLAGLDARLAAPAWQRSALTWTVPGPAKLFDSAWPGDGPDARRRCPAGNLRDQLLRLGQHLRQTRCPVGGLTPQQHKFHNRAPTLHCCPYPDLHSDEYPATRPWWSLSRCAASSAATSHSLKRSTASTGSSAPARATYPL